MSPKEFGQRVYRMRMAKEWSQETCAAQAEISVRTVQMIESYRIVPTIETAEKLAAAFQCDWKELLGEVPVIAGTSALRKRKPK